MLFDSFEAYSVPEIRKETAVLTLTENMLYVLSTKGEISDSLKSKIAEEDNLELLDNWFKLAVNSLSVEEFERQIK